MSNVKKVLRWKPWQELIKDVTKLASDFLGDNCHLPKISRLIIEVVFEEKVEEMDANLNFICETLNDKTSYTLHNHRHFGFKVNTINETTFQLEGTIWSKCGLCNLAYDKDGNSCQSVNCKNDKEQPALQARPTTLPDPEITAAAQILVDLNK